ncbi:MAG TPA: type 1 glutamine amidotransferase [Xanthobacteraceae bacterium]|jgi:GMP synthase-like glutamine amidotransferase
MRFLVFQHAAVEHPGVLRDFLRADAIAWDAVELDHGAVIPPLEGYDALMVFGGPMDVWQENRHPWLAREKAAIRRWVSEKRAPFLGVCLGHQLLADAFGGKVELMPKPEIGVLDVKLTDAGRAAPLFEGMPATFPVLQWHGAEVAELPAGAVKLAESEQCSIQAFQLGEKAYGIQYHVEQDEHTVSQWGEIPEYRRALESMLGADGQDRLQHATSKCMETFGASAKILYRNFRRIVASG